MGFAQDVSLENSVRFYMWASTEIYPGIEKPMAKDDITSVAVKKIRQTAPFILEGMVYGWNFGYTPYDKARKVQEIFDFSPIQAFTAEETASIRYEKSWIKDQRLNVWVEFDRSDSQKLRYNSWKSIKHPNIKGIGYAPLSEGFEGIQKACAEALKQAVREYERKHIKNKPKEVLGKALLSHPPLIGVNAGRYMVTLDFFMESDKIVEYKTF